MKSGLALSVCSAATYLRPLKPSPTTSGKPYRRLGPNPRHASLWGEGVKGRGRGSLIRQAYNKLYILSGNVGVVLYAHSSYTPAKYGN